MKAWQIRQIFERTFKGHKNLLTPEILEYGKVGEYVYEISYGESILNRGETIYGITILTLDGERSELSQGGFRRLDHIREYIKTL